MRALYHPNISRIMSSSAFGPLSQFCPIAAEGLHSTAHGRDYNGAMVHDLGIQKSNSLGSEGLTLRSKISCHKRTRLNTRSCRSIRLHLTSRRHRYIDGIRVSEYPPKEDA